MKIAGVQLPRWWWVPFMGVGGLLVLGMTTVGVGWMGGVLTEAERARLPVERGIATLADLDRAIELNVDYVEAYEQRARKRMEAGDLAGAVADMDRAVEISPGNQGLLQLRAEVRRAKVGATTGPAR